MYCATYFLLLFMYVVIINRDKSSIFLFTRNTIEMNSTRLPNAYISTRTKFLVKLFFHLSYIVREHITVISQCCFQIVYPLSVVFCVIRTLREDGRMNVSAISKNETGKKFINNWWKVYLILLNNGSRRG